MQKKRIFVKIYLWFWLTTIALLLTMFTIDIVTQSSREKEDLQHFIGPLLVLQGQQAVNIYENEPVASFNRFIEHMGKMPGFRIYIFENADREITGHEVPPEISALITKAVKDKITDTVIFGDKILVLKSINSSKMRKYLIASEVPHRPIRLLPPLGRPPGPPLGSEPGLRPGPGLGEGMSFLLLRVIAILIVSGIICYLLARYLTAPIIKLRNATRQFAAGDFSIRLNQNVSRRKDEIADLALDFDHMAGRIESLLTSQRNLLRDISHELRTPLARINVALELCRQRSEGEAIKYLERIRQEAEKLNELIEQILTLKRVESIIAEFKKEKIDLTHLISQVAADADFEAKSLNKAVKIVQDEECIIMGNGDLIKRAVENIVRNAILYTVEGSTVEIFLKRIGQDRHSYVSITVRDYGHGVPENEIINIFQPFYRIEEDRDRKTGGTGIGLAIADAAVRLHTGRIKAANAPRGGLSVEIILPV
ncbi:MAG: ATP-binding protein [Smithellaceae bacterium]